MTKWIAGLGLLLSLPLFSQADSKTFKPRPADPALNGAVAAAAKLTWYGDLEEALAVAAKEGKLVFIDFTGETCLNCKLNEKNVFPKEAVKAGLEKRVRVSLYTDTVPASFYKKDPGVDKREEDAEANKKFQKQVFGTEQLPLYAIVKPTKDGFEVVGVYGEGKITDVDAFAKFLAEPGKAK